MTSLLKTCLTLILFGAVGALAGVLGARGWLDMSRSDFVAGDYADLRAETGSDVILLGTRWCGYCANARAHLNARSVVFADLDVETSTRAEAWMRQLGARGVPVLLIGDRQIRGFDPGVIDAALDVLPAARTQADAPAQLH